MENELPKRKPNRLGGFDYNSSGAYFITICTKDRKGILSLQGKIQLSQDLFQHLKDFAIRNMDSILGKADSTTT